MNTFNIEFNDDEIFELLREALQDITGYEGEITLETELIDELGLDSLGFLDLFFTIQTSIQKEVTNEQMRSMIIEELGQHKNSKLKNLSDGEIDRILYPELTVRNFFNIIRRQISNQVPTIELELMPNDFLATGNIDDFLEKNFETLKQQQYDIQIKQFNISDKRITDIIQKTFDAIDQATIKALLDDQDRIKDMVTEFMKDKFDFRSTTNLKVYISAAFYTPNQDESLLFGKNSLSELFLLYLENKKSTFEVPANLNLDEFLQNPKIIVKDEIDFDERNFWETQLAYFLRDNVSEIRRTATSNDFNLDPDVIAQELLSDKAIQQSIVEQLVQEQIKDIFSAEIQRQTDTVEDLEIYDFVKSTFAGDDSIERKIQQVFTEQQMSGDVFQDYMKTNFDRIALEESKRIIEDKELRNRLVQDYIKENYDPMEAMQLNTAEAMREIQQAITKKYIDDNMDEIISRYANEYMNEMLSAMPGENEIEVEGDVQEDFMRKFAAQMESQDDIRVSDDDLNAIEKFIKRYNIKDPMIEVFIESNFEEFQAIFKSLEKVSFDQDQIQDRIINKYPLRTSMILYRYVFDESYQSFIQEEFARYVIEKQSELVIEIVMKRQLEFMWDEEKQEEENVIYQELFDTWFYGRFEELANSIDEDEVQRGLESFLKNYKISMTRFLNTLINFPDPLTRQRIYSNFYNDVDYLNELKAGFLNNFLRYIEEEDLENATKWIEFFFTQSPEHELYQLQAAKQDEFWLATLNQIKSMNDDEFVFRSDKSEPYSSLLQKEFIAVLLSRWIVDMSLEFIDKNKRKVAKSNPSDEQTIKISDWFEAIRRHASIKRYENGAKNRLQDKLSSRCSSGSYNFSPNQALYFLMNNIDDFIKWLCSLTNLDSWKLISSSGIDQAVQLIDQLDSEIKHRLLTELLNKNISKIEIIKTISDNSIAPAMRHLTSRTSQAWSEFVALPVLEIEGREELESILQKIISKKQSSKEEEIEIDAKATPLFYEYINYLSHSQTKDIAYFIDKIQKNLGMKSSKIHMLAEESIERFTCFFRSELESLEDELLEFARNIIVQKFDFLTADMVQQEFSAKENVILVKRNLEDNYIKDNAFDFFKFGLKGILFKDSDNNTENQKKQFKEYCCRKIVVMIDQKAAEIEKGKLN